MWSLRWSTTIDVSGAIFWWCFWGMFSLQWEEKVRCSKCAQFEFLGCNKNILHSYTTFLQKTSWVLNKLVSFITPLKMETKTTKWMKLAWGFRYISKELWNNKVSLISWALVTDSVHLFWLSFVATQLKFLCLGNDRTISVNIVMVSNLQPLLQTSHSD